MRITGIQIERFGAWSGLKLENLSKGVTVFFGPNEAGKTTLLQFFRAMFFGFGNEDTQRYLAPISNSRNVLQVGTRGGGSMGLVAENAEYHLRRYVSLTKEQDLQGDLRLTSNQGERVGAHRLIGLLAGVDETTFNNVFAIGLREIQQLATLDDTEAARQLYSLSTGTDRVSLVDIMRQLRATHDRVLGKDARDEDSYLGQLLVQRKRLDQQLRGLGGNRDRWVQLRTQAGLLREEADRLEAMRRTTGSQIDRLQRALRCQPHVQLASRLQQELTALGDAREVGTDSLDRLTELEGQIAALEKGLEATRKKWEETQRRREQLERDTPPIRGQSRIESLLEQRFAVENLTQRRAQAKDTRDELELEIQAEQEKLGVAVPGDATAGGSAQKSLVLDPRRLLELIEPARQLERQSDLLEQAQREAAAHKEELAKVEQEIASLLTKEQDLFDQNDRRDLLAAVKRTGDMAHDLRKRVTAERQLEKLQRQRQRIASLEADAYRNQMLPWEIQQGLGALFVVGGFLALLSFFGPWFDLLRDTRFGLGLMSGVLLLTATTLKLVFEAATSDDLDRLKRDQRAIAEQYESLQATLNDVGSRLPHPKGQALRLEDAEARLKRLESLLPLETQRRQVRTIATRTEQQAQAIAEQLKQERHAWEELLRKLGLSSKLSPTQVRQLVGDSGNLTSLQRRFAEADAVYAETDREWQGWLTRIAAMARDVDLKNPAERDPLRLLEALAEALEAQTSVRQQREALDEQERKLKQQQQRQTAEFRQLQRRHQSILNATGALDADDLRARQRRWEQKCQLAEKRTQAETALAAEWGASDEPDFRTFIDQTSLEALQQHLQSLLSEDAQHAQRLREIESKQKELAEQLQLIAADDRSARLRLERNLLTHRIETAVEDWRRVSTIAQLLKSVYKKYEKERQPDTLRDASRYFERISKGRYTRVWTPLAEDVLLTDSVDGRTIPVQLLSSGTREQLYLSLRLALVSSYARRGIHMPMVLDDVLVNFDVERTRAAAEVLVEFAQGGHQIFVFTCHQHAMEIFRGLNVEVRELPSRDVPPVAEGKPRAQPLRVPPPKDRPPRRPAPLVLGYSRLPRRGFPSRRPLVPIAKTPSQLMAK